MKFLDAARGLVRPYLAYAFGTALIAAAFVAGPEKAFELLREPALLVIGFYVGSRSQAEATK
jgi:hypothetical protein